MFFLDKLKNSYIALIGSLGVFSLHSATVSNIARQSNVSVHLPTQHSPMFCINMNEGSSLGVLEAGTIAADGIELDLNSSSSSVDQVMVLAATDTFSLQNGAGLNAINNTPDSKFNVFIHSPNLYLDSSSVNLYGANMALSTTLPADTVLDMSAIRNGAPVNDAAFWDGQTALAASDSVDAGGLYFDKMGTGGSGALYRYNSDLESVLTVPAGIDLGEVTRKENLTVSINEPNEDNPQWVGNITMDAGASVGFLETDELTVQGNSQLNLESSSDSTDQLMCISATGSVMVDNSTVSIKNNTGSNRFSVVMHGGSAMIHNSYLCPENGANFALAAHPLSYESLNISSLSSDAGVNQDGFWSDGERISSQSEGFIEISNTVVSPTNGGDARLYTSDVSNALQAPLLPPAQPGTPPPAKPDNKLDQGLNKEEDEGQGGQGEGEGQGGQGEGQGGQGEGEGEGELPPAKNDLEVPMGEKEGEGGQGEGEGQGGQGEGEGQGGQGEGEGQGGQGEGEGQGGQGEGEGQGGQGEGEGQGGQGEGEGRGGQGEGEGQGGQGEGEGQGGQGEGEGQGGQGDKGDQGRPAISPEVTDAVQQALSRRVDGTVLEEVARFVETHQGQVYTAEEAEAMESFWADQLRAGNPSLSEAQISAQVRYIQGFLGSYIQVQEPEDRGGLLPDPPDNNVPKEGDQNPGEGQKEEDNLAPKEEGEEPAPKQDDDPAAKENGGGQVPMAGLTLAQALGQRLAPDLAKAVIDYIGENADLTAEALNEEIASFLTTYLHGSGIMQPAEIEQVIADVQEVVQVHHTANTYKGENTPGVPKAGDDLGPPVDGVIMEALTRHVPQEVAQYALEQLVTLRAGSEAYMAGVDSIRAYIVNTYPGLSEDEVNSQLSNIVGVFDAYNSIAGEAPPTPMPGDQNLTESEILSRLLDVSVFSLPEAETAFLEDYVNEQIENAEGITLELIHSVNEYLRTYIEGYTPPPPVDDTPPPAAPVYAPNSITDLRGEQFNADKLAQMYHIIQNNITANQISESDYIKLYELITGDVDHEHYSPAAITVEQIEAFQTQYREDGFNLNQLTHKDVLGLQNAISFSLGSTPLTIGRLDPPPVPPVPLTPPDPEPVPVPDVPVIELDPPVIEKSVGPVVSVIEKLVDTLAPVAVEEEPEQIIMPEDEGISYLDEIEYHYEGSEEMDKLKEQRQTTAAREKAQASLEAR